MQRKIVITADGSSTIYLPEWNEQYHSKHGAIQEAYHVFIKHGLHYYCYPELDSGSHPKNKVSHNEQFDCTQDRPSRKSYDNVSILEIGFGTGLNTFITLLEAEKLKKYIKYFGVEGYPVSMNEINQLNYSKQLNTDGQTSLFKKLHSASWETSHQITSHFSLIKQNRFFSEVKEKDCYNIIYFDAFGARVQPELWTESIFQKMFDALKIKGILVTYSAKGSVRRAMEAVGFNVERLPGPPGKREMLRATKLSAK